MQTAPLASRGAVLLYIIFYIFYIPIYNVNVGEVVDHSCADGVLKLIEHRFAVIEHKINAIIMCAERSGIINDFLHQCSLFG